MNEDPNSQGRRIDSPSIQHHHAATPIKPVSTVLSNPQTKRALKHLPCAQNDCPQIGHAVLLRVRSPALCFMRGEGAPNDSRDVHGSRACVCPVQRMPSKVLPTRRCSRTLTPPPLPPPLYAVRIARDNENDLVVCAVESSVMACLPALSRSRRTGESKSAPSLHFRLAVHLLPGGHLLGKQEATHRGTFFLRGRDHGGLRGGQGGALPVRLPSRAWFCLRRARGARHGQSSGHRSCSLPLSGTRPCAPRLGGCKMQRALECFTMFSYS